jgi:hypothetical protein
MDDIRFNHYIPYFENGCYDIVVNVQLPSASIERITIIVSTDGYDLEPPINTLQTDFLSQERIDPLIAKIRHHATGDARLLAKTDLRYQDSASEPDLKAIAEYLAHKCIKRSDIGAMISGSDSEEEDETFIESFIDKYREIIERGGMAVLDGEEESLRTKARADKERDMGQNGACLYDEVEIICRAAIQKHDKPSYLDKRYQPSYFREMADYARRYLSLYQEADLEENLEANIKWEDRLKRAHLFRE